MGKQSNLEKIGIERRNIEATRNDYNKNNAYSAQHDTARTHDDNFHPLGKGTGHGGHTHSTPDYSLGKNRYIPQFDTENAGGSYDKYGYKGIGGRQFLSTINIYNPTNQYGENYVDTSANVADGQYQVKIS